jgi:hypothetical protein
MIAIPIASEPAKTIASTSARPKGRSSLPATSRLWSSGTATVAAMKSSTTTSMTSANRFCSTHPRQGTW